MKQIKQKATNKNIYNKNIKKTKQMNRPGVLYYYSLNNSESEFYKEKPRLHLFPI